jgi:hypothetical protein
MNKTLSVSAILLFGVSISLTVTPKPANAQGPAGVGATAAAQDSSRSPHSLNPIKWIKKDSKDSAAAPASRTDSEKKLTPALQSQGVLAANATATDACAPFPSLDGCQPQSRREFQLPARRRYWRSHLRGHLWLQGR